MAILVNVSDVDLHRGVVFCGDKSVGGSTKSKNGGCMEGTICVARKDRRPFLDPIELV
jgi:hypothetical protein